MTTSNPMWIDEIDFMKSQTEPLSEAIRERFRYWEPTSDHTTTQAFDRNAWARQNDVWKQHQERLRKQKESCLHGTRPYVINWSPGTHPFGPREYWVNIPNLAGGPYLLNEEDHKIFHDGRFPHDHLTTTEIRNSRNRKAEKMLPLKDPMSPWR